MPLVYEHSPGRLDLLEVCIENLAGEGELCCGSFGILLRVAM